ncbi:MAG: hypothetical protein PUK75_15235 [bacterium]|nr:hypothetical protein [bacterium]MDY4099951.1 hypothetical protein [Lachnospiraceae bacterium]
MNTKPIPAIIMLTAGFVTCIIGIVQHDDFGVFVKKLFLILIAFYLLGCIVKLVLDKGFLVMDDPLSDYEGLELEEDLMDEMVMTDDTYQDDFRDM